MNTVIDLANVDGPVIDDMSGDYIDIEMMDQTNITNAMFNAIQSIDIPGGRLAAFESHDGNISLRNELVAYEDGQGTTNLSMAGVTLENASRHIVGIQAAVEELENGNYGVSVLVNHDGSYEQHSVDDRQALINYEIDAENGEILSRDAQGLRFDDDVNQWVIDAAQAVEHSFTSNLGPVAQESISQFRPEGAAVTVGEPPLDTQFNSLSELSAELVNDGMSGPKVQQHEAVVPQ